MKRALLFIFVLCFWVNVKAKGFNKEYNLQQTSTQSVIDTPISKGTIYVRKAVADTSVTLYLKKAAKYKITVAPVKASTGGYDWYKRISVVKSFDNATDKTAAASVSLVYPKDSVSSQNFAFAVGYNVLPNKSYHNGEVSMQLNPFFGWQKNTLSSKKQNVITSGLNFQIALPKFCHEDNLQFFAVSSVNYKNDRVKSAEGTQANLYLSPIFNGKAGKFYFLPDAEMKNSVIKILYDLYGGLEYEDVSTAKKEADKGNTYRLYARIMATISPLPELLNDRLQFTPDYTYRDALSKSIASEQKVNKLWKYSINIIIVKKADSGFGDVSIGYDYQKGVDPTTGYQDQAVGTFSVKIKITPGAK